jgi:hypothetical protein
LEVKATKLVALAPILTWKSLVLPVPLKPSVDSEPPDRVIDATTSSFVEVALKTLPVPLTLNLLAGVVVPIPTLVPSSYITLSCNPSVPSHLTT